MRYKRYMIILVLAVFALGVAGVCASDTDTAVESSADDSIIEADDVQAIGENENDEVISEENAGTFTDLRQMIRGAGDDATITLDKHYEVDDSGEIDFSYSRMVIDGKGHKLDAKNKTSIFIVRGSDVTIKNMTFANSNGVAVYWYGVNGVVSDCKFINNTDGAIHWNAWGGNVSGCSFINNTANNDDGGAIFWNDDGGCVCGCSFVGNTANDGDGGAIFWNGMDGCVSGCSFVGNTANDGDGGAIEWNGYGGCVSGCSFVGNTANDGGAIYWNGGGCVSGCSFVGNTAIDLGGVIRIPATNNLAAECCWFGNDASNFRDSPPTSGPVNSICRLFLNATVNPNTLPDLSTSEVIFKLYLYNSSSGDVFEYDNAPFDYLNFTITATNGFADKNSIKPGENVTYTATNMGTGTVTASIGDARYTIELENTILNPMLSVLSQEAYFTQNATIALNYSSGATGKVNITLKGRNGNNYTFTDLDLNATLSLGAINVDEYDVNVTYSGDDNFINATAVGTLKVVKANSTLTVNDITFDYNGTGFTEISFTGAVGVDASVIGHGEAVITVNDSSIAVSGLDAGNYTLTVTTIPDANHNPVTKTVNVTVNKIDSTLAVDDITFDYKGSGSGNVSFSGASGVNASVFNQSEAAVNVTGNTVTVSGLNAGNYTLTLTTIPDANHNPVTVNATITVNRLKTDLTASEITTTYNINKDLVITLKDANGNTLAGFNVAVDLNGVKTYTTDSKGQVKVSTKGLAPKVYTAKISFNGDNNYINSSADVKVTVNKAAPKLTAKAKTFKSSVKTKKYTITLKDNTGKAIKKAKVALKVKGKTYKATTNSKGKATFKIKKLNKKGKFKAVIKFKGDKYYKKATKKAKIKVIITFETVSKGSKDKSTVKQIQQALKDNGYYLSYKGHYLKVDGKFSSCTFRSVKEFQKDKHLKVTGKVDEKTAKKLGII